MSYQGVPVLLLGASGFIGRWVARALGECGAKLFLVVRNRESATDIFKQYGIAGSLIEMDLTAEPASFAELYRDIQPAITFNLAGYGVDRTERNEMRAQQVNTALIGKLCAVISGQQHPSWQGQQLVHIGSALEYGTLDGDLSEDSQPAPTTLYGQTKLAGTCELSRYNERGQINGITVRLFTVYGPGEHEGRLLPSLLAASGNRQPLDLTTGLQKRDFTYVGDVAEGLLRIGSAHPPDFSIVNLATGHLQTVRNFTETAADVLSIPSEHLRFGAIPVRTEEMQHAPVANERLRQLTGWLPRTSVQAGVRKTMEFINSDG